MCFSLQPPSQPPYVSAAIDLLYGGIYCFMCQDYIYDKDMEQIAKEEQRKAWKLQGLILFKYLLKECSLSFLVIPGPPTHQKVEINNREMGYQCKL